VKYIVDKETFAKYEEFTFLSALKSDPNVRWCPNPKGCGNAIVGDSSGSVKKMICDVCQFEFCFDCNEQWHSGTCEQFQQWKLENSHEDAEFAKWAKANTKQCPNCGIKVQKKSGCNHMTCTACQYQFCWLCNGKYTPSHYDVYNIRGCPGMQFKQDDKFGAGKRMAMKALITGGVVLGGAIAIPLLIPVAIIGAPIYGGYRLLKRRQRKRV